MGNRNIIEEIKVRLYDTDPRANLEIWQAKDHKGNRYFGRKDYAPYIWYELNHGFDVECNPNFKVGNHVVFIICDEKWNEIFHEYNDKLKYPEHYPTLQEACERAWSRIKDRYPSIRIHGFEEWITRFAPVPLKRVDKVNWCVFHNRITKREILTYFVHLGRRYAIHRFVCKHTRCDARWYRYSAGRIIKGRGESSLRFFGYEFGPEVFPDTKNHTK